MLVVKAIVVLFQALKMCITIVILLLLTIRMVVVVVVAMTMVALATAMATLALTKAGAYTLDACCCLASSLEGLAGQYLNASLKRFTIASQPMH
jgi:hypothetical protein